MLAAILLTLSLATGAAGDPAWPRPGRDGSSGEPITAIPQPTGADPLRVALGAAMFADTRLSGDGRRSCASCHDLRTNGASANRFDQTPGGAPLAMNTSTVFNAALNFRQTWSGQTRTLEQAARLSIADPGLMGSTVPEAVARLAADPATARSFRAAYGHAPDNASLIDALAVFERTLLTPDSPFDRWLQGEDSALSADAVGGYRLFQAIGCSSCHQGRNVGGNLFERAGIFRDVDDPARPLMRVPSLRNVAVTPPYFSRGSAATLGDAVHTMATAQLGRSLSDAQTAQIVAFLTSLTGRYHGRDLVRPGAQ